MNNTVKILNGLSEIYNDIPFISNLKIAMKKYPDVDFSDTLSLGQIRSKKWLIDTLYELNINLGTIFLLGGWHATLAALMLESNKLNIGKIRSFDIDPICADIADTINRTPWVNEDWIFKASTADMYELNYHETTFLTRRANGTELELTEVADTFINTSCEHLEFYSDWYDILPTGKLVVLQSNDFLSGKDHVNCVSSINEFKIQSPMSEYFYEGELYIPEADYTRFMIIGTK